MTHLPLSGLNASDFGTLISVPNDATNGILVGGFIIGVVVVIAVRLSRAPNMTFAGSVTMAAWIGTILSGLAMAAGWVNFLLPIGLLLAAAFGLFALHLNRNV